MDRIEQIAIAYVAFLTAFPWDQPLAVRGAREGLTKFLSNAYLASFCGAKKHQLTQLISRDARDLLAAGHTASFVFEHLAPKSRLIQIPCEKAAKAGELTVDGVLTLLRKYWVLATVTSTEDKRLARQAMPKDWDGIDVLARYRSASIELIPNPFMIAGVPPFELPVGNSQ
jgi:hypothetical protein